MTQVVVANPSLPRRVAHVIVVALCTASTLALIGAEHADNARPVRKSAAPTAKQVAGPVKPAVVEAAVTSANVLPAPASLELMTDELAAAPATVKIEPAAKTVVVRMEVTAYCPCVKCCGPSAQGITASGKRVNYNNGRFVAADTSVLPFGTKLTIPGYANGQAVEVIDRGGGIKGNKLDLYFDSHSDALVWGRQHLDVEVAVSE